MTLAAAQVVNTIAARMAGAGLRAETSRLWAFAEADLPAWKVTAEPEDCELQSVGDDIHLHTLTVQLHGIVRAVSDADDSLHAITAQALAAVFAKPAPFDLALAGITRDLATEGEAAVATVSIAVRAAFYARASEPETILS